MQSIYWAEESRTLYMLGEASRLQGKLSLANSSFEKARDVRKRVLKDEIEDELAVKALESSIPFWSR